MSESIIPKEWVGGPDGDEWTLEVEHDQFEEGGPMTVTVYVEHPSDKTSALAVLSPAEAREVADALHVYAFLAEKEQRRKEADHG